MVLIFSISYVSNFKTLFIIEIPYTCFILTILISTLKPCESISRGQNSTWVQILLPEPERTHFNSWQPYVLTKLWNIKVHIKIPASVTVIGLSVPFSISHESQKNFLARKRPREVNGAVCLLSWKAQTSVCLKYLPNSIISNHIGYNIRHKYWLSQAWRSSCLPCAFLGHVFQEYVWLFYPRAVFAICASSQGSGALFLLRNKSSPLSTSDCFIHWTTV